MEDYISKLSNNLRLGNCAIFFGAGLSKNSGMPLALDLIDYLLNSLDLSKANIETIMNVNLPFEALMESFMLSPASINILKVFSGVKPNTNHLLIAKLIKYGVIKNIFTTNFDLLMEKALEIEGLKEKTDYKKYFTERQFSKIDYKHQKKPFLIKIHGSIDDPESIRTTLKHVANKKLSENRMKIIRHLFSDGEHKIVLVMGYSCSDQFDILPQIQSIQKTEKEISFVEHSEDKTLSNLEVQKLPDTFSSFNGARIPVDTDEFVTYLWNTLKCRR